MRPPRTDIVSEPTILTTAQLVERAAELSTPGVRRVLGITGAPGAGKSTLAALLIDALGPQRAALAGMDAFHLANDVLRKLGRLDRKGAIDTFDDAGYAALIRRMATAAPDDGPVYAPRFDRDVEESINAAVEIASNVPLVITEGNYLLAGSGAWPSARSAMAEVWFLAPARDERLAQLIARHERFGRSPAEAQSWALGTDEANAQLVLSTASRADLVVHWRH